MSVTNTKPYNPLADPITIASHRAPVNDPGMDSSKNLLIKELPAPEYTQTTRF